MTFTTAQWVAIVVGFMIYGLSVLVAGWYAVLVGGFFAIAVVLIGLRQGGGVRR